MEQARIELELCKQSARGGAPAFNMSSDAVDMCSNRLLRLTKAALNGTVPIEDMTASASSSGRMERYV
jgi:hypothetical protein